MKKHAARPFTLVEMIVVMGVIMLMAVIAAPAYSSLFSGRKTTLAANMLNAAVLEARAHAVSSKVYTAIVFVPDQEKVNGSTVYRSFRLAEVYHNPDTNNTTYKWRRWVPDSTFVILPDNTLIPDANKDFGRTPDGKMNTSIGTSTPYKVKNVPHNDFPGSSKSSETSDEKSIIIKPSGQLASENNIVVRFVEANRYKASSAKAPRLPLNISWLTCKSKFLPATEK